MRMTESRLIMPSAWVVVVVLLCNVVIGTPQRESAINITKNSDNLVTRQDGLVHNGLQSDTFIHKQNITRDENHPLLTVLETAPHSMSLMIKPRDYKLDTMIRLLYERVSLNKGPFMLHLDDPVIEFIPLIRRAQSHTLAELPMGKYIVCGEAMVMGEVYQASCFETRIERLDSNSKCLAKL